MSRSRSVGDRSIVGVHAWIVVTMTLLTAGVAVVLALQRPVEHTAESRVEVLTRSNRGAPLIPDMGTEREVATSGDVTKVAAGGLGLTPEEATKGLSVSALPDTTVLTIQYGAPDDVAALRGAVAFTRAYVALRNGGSGPPAVTVITDPHTLPGDQGQPLGLVLAVGLVVGAGLGLALAWSWDRLTNVVRSTGELESTGIPVVATDLEVQGEAGAGYGYLGGQLMALTDHQAESVRILVTSLRDDGTARAVATRLAAVLTGDGRSVETLNADSPPRAAANGLVQGRGAVVVQSSPRLLDDPETWLVAQRADVVLLAVRVGRLSRRDLDEAVRGLGHASGPWVAWVACRRGTPEAFAAPSTEVPDAPARARSWPWRRMTSAPQDRDEQEQET